MEGSERVEAATESPSGQRRLAAWETPLLGVARTIAAIFGPIIRGIPGVVFFGGCLAGCLAVWFAAVVLSEAASVQDRVFSGAVADRAATLAEVGAALEVSGSALPAWLVWAAQSTIVRDLGGLTGVIGFVSVLAMFAIWWERKVSAAMQSRLGPMRVGGWHGWSQSMADGLKLIAKEDIIPADADGPIFRLAPYVTLVPVLIAFIALPFGAYWIFRELDVALLFILAMLGVEVIGVLLAGWASNNKWSLLGAMREACQVVSYEIPMGMTLLVPIMIVGSLSLEEIAAAQTGGWPNWLAFHSPFAAAAALLYFVASLASCKRAPFDLPEAESELVAGFLTEYSGFRWSVFFFAEYAAMFIVSGLLVILFFGGWDAPWAGLIDPRFTTRAPGFWTQLAVGVFVTGPVWFILKCIGVIYVQMWLRWTLPRIRIDQVLYACVQVMLPLSMAILLGSTLWELFVQQFPAFAGFAGAVRWVLALCGLIVCAAIGVVAVNGRRRRAALVGQMAVLRPLRAG